MLKSSNTDQKRICFAILVHHKKNVVLDLLENIKFYCPNSTVVLYNGGEDPDLCNELGVPVCPTSRKLQYGVTAIYLLETMKWIEESNLEYDYLINLDSDSLFVREGYEKFITEQMKDKDYLGVDTKPLEKNNFCGMQLKNEFHIWESLFGTNPLYESFNVGQVFSKRLVRSFLDSKHFNLLKENLNKTKAFGIDEIAYVSMASLLGFELYSYPPETGNSIRYRPHFALDETVSLLHKNKVCYMVHPVHRDMEDETRKFITHMLQQKVQFEPQKRKQHRNQEFGEISLFIHQDKGSKEILTSSPGSEIAHRIDSRNVIRLLPSTISKIKDHSFTALRSKYGKIEIICRIGNKLYHYTIDERNGSWSRSKPIAFGVTGTPMFIESSYGNFEVVVPLKEGGLGHWWRNNKHPKRVWIGPMKFGKARQFQKGILVENNERQLTVVVEVEDGFRYFVEDDGRYWKWNGPYI